MSMRAPQPHFIPSNEMGYDHATYALVLEFEQTGVGHVPFRVNARIPGAEEHAILGAIHSWWAARGYAIDGFTAWLDGAERMWHLTPVVKPQKDRPIGWTRAPEWDGLA